MNAVDFGKHTHIFRIYVRTQAQDANTGDLTDTLKDLGKIAGRIDTRREGFEIEEGMAMQSGWRSTLFLRYERERSSKLTGMAIFVDLSDQNKTYKAEGPPVDERGDFRELKIPVVFSPEEKLPSQV